jgi:hypothetical protein
MQEQAGRIARRRSHSCDWGTLNQAGGPGGTAQQLCQEISIESKQRVQQKQGKPSKHSAA